MANEPVQSFDNHRRNDYFYYVAGTLIALGVLYHAYSFFTTLSTGALIQLLFSVGVAMTFHRVRGYALVLQDRIIRHEMQYRLHRVLTGDLAGAGSRLTLSQMIGLRFASDAELPELVRKALADSSLKSSDLKKQIKSWQPDHQRV